MSNFLSQIIARVISSAISFIYLFTGYKSGLTGKEIKKIIVVPNRIVNIVAI